ncbi:MAG: hypothetical protein Fur0041_18830 [Bacteroidia bacterium]
MAELFRQFLKPLKLYFSDPSYREWLNVRSFARKTKGPASVRIGPWMIKTAHPESFLWQYEQIFRKGQYAFRADRSDPLIVVCGANIGLELFYFKKHYPDCIIHAFEADPDIAGILMENVKSNQLKDVHVYNTAVWIDHEGVAFEPEGALGGKAGSGVMKVNSIRLKDFLEKHDQIDLLVMDIEGAESIVLEDCRALLSRIKHLFVEWHGVKNEDRNLSTVLGILENEGFSWRLYNDLPSSPFNNRIVENGFDAMAEIYAERTTLQQR